MKPPSPIELTIMLIMLKNHLEENAATSKFASRLKSEKNLLALAQPRRRRSNRTNRASAANKVLAQVADSSPLGI